MKTFREFAEPVRPKTTVQKESTFVEKSAEEIAASLPQKGKKVKFNFQATTNEEDPIL